MVVVVVVGWRCMAETYSECKTSKYFRGFTWLRVESGGTFRRPSRQVEPIRKA